MREAKCIWVRDRENHSRFHPTESIRSIFFFFFWYAKVCQIPKCISYLYKSISVEHDVKNVHMVYLYGLCMSVYDHNTSIYEQQRRCNMLQHSYSVFHLFSCRNLCAMRCKIASS